MPTPPATTDGLLLVDKPAGVSSHDIVGAARRCFGEKRIGHAGTLDPFATGLLVLCAGRATRLLPHLPNEPKVYEATIRFGSETDTEDLHGAVVRESARPSLAAVTAALPQFVGHITQVPPAYSAKRIDGQRAYALARAGETVVLEPVQIEVHRWEVLAARERDGRLDELDVRITCGGGTYIRSLARDLARAVDSAAHLIALRRTRSGSFDVRDAVTLEDLREKRATMRPPLDAVPHVPVQPLTAEELLKIVRGVDVPARVDGAWAALVREDRPVLVALAERRADRWQPRVVMREA
jgi:tRNA pseudouridine55 synthase